MNTTLQDQQVMAVLDRYARKKADWEGRQDGSPMAEGRRKREAVLAQLAGLVSKIDDAIGAFNDMAAATGAEIEVHTGPVPHYAVDVFRLALKGVFTAQYELVISVDTEGVVSGFIATPEGDSKRLVKRLPMSQVGVADISQMLVALVDAELALAED